MVIASILKGKGNQVVSLGPDDTILDLARLLARHRIGAALVRAPDGRLLGIVSERDVIRGMAGHGTGTTTLPVSQVMTRDLVTVLPETQVIEALGLMTQRRVRHLPVLDAGGGLIGMVSIGDLVKARIEEAEQEAEELKHYVTAAG
ncbi:CBS domain-containing protein [Paeniroseomonas aquatica]|uniref:CBS domain-containing protein n=1 Tax=Paeniroseomonas aquatica TaxID=373043 RepID=A0ABT8A251_9PROT|nr:CBS domain-containing protein [Paeniroseomonas aquatica]MDN3563830.1 CBS domain-containing protein [Paeniroseomonas aquatica]